MKVLVIGNQGYVGSVLIPYLAEKAVYSIEGFDAGYFEECLMGFRPEVFLEQQHRGDVRDFPPFLLRDVDAVVYLAALSNDAMGDRFGVQTQQINCDAAIQIAKMAKEKGVKRFVFASSCSLYGAGDDSPRNEQDELNPLTTYAKSKAQAEVMLQALSDASFQISCLRFATACGGSSRLRLDLVLNDFVASAFLFHNITVLSDGSPWRPLIHVNDMARAIEWAIGREGDGYLAVNVGSNHSNHQIRSLAHAVAKHIPGTMVKINTDAQQDKRSYRVDFGLFDSLAPNHQPQMNLEATVEQLVEQFKAYGLSQKKYASSGFKRLPYLERDIQFT